MRLQNLVNTGMATAVLFGAITGCAKKETDPIEGVKSLIPAIEQRLNKRDLAGLKGMGTEAFESNAFVIDVFADRARDSVDLSLDRIQQDGAHSTLILHMTSRQQIGESRRLYLELEGNGKWKIASYRIVEESADTSGQ